MKNRFEECRNPQRSWLGWGMQGWLGGRGSGWARWGLDQVGSSRME